MARPNPGLAVGRDITRIICRKTQFEETRAHLSLFLLYIKLTLKDTLYYAGENWELCQGLSNRTIVSIHQSMHCFHQRTSTPDSPSVLQGGTNLVRRIQNKGRIANLLGGSGGSCWKGHRWFVVCLFIYFAAFPFTIAAVEVMGKVPQPTL